MANTQENRMKAKLKKAATEQLLSKKELLAASYILGQADDDIERQVFSELFNDFTGIKNQIK